jgi:hypothetical protein
MAWTYERSEAAPLPTARLVAPGRGGPQHMREVTTIGSLYSGIAGL